MDGGEQGVSINGLVENISCVRRKNICISFHLLRRKLGTNHDWRCCRPWMCCNVIKELETTVIVPRTPVQYDKVGCNACDLIRCHERQKRMCDDAIRRRS